jgi:hypothetical protein
MRNNQIALSQLSLAARNISLSKVLHRVLMATLTLELRGTAFGAKGVTLASW